MDYNKFEIKDNKPLEIVLLGDLHYGAAQCDIDLFKKVINKIKNDKNLKVILMGDIIENANRFSVGAGVYEQTMQPEEQIKGITELLKPIAKQILFYHRGNHCERSYRMCGVDPGQTISKSLGCPYIKNMALTEIFIGKKIKYTLFSWHGSGSSRTTAGRLKVLETSSDSFSADFYCQGHNHDLFATTIPKREIVNGHFVDVFKHYVLTGSFTKWDNSYSEQFGYPMMKLGCPKITLNNKQKEIKVDLEYV